MIHILTKASMLGLALATGSLLGQCVPHAHADEAGYVNEVGAHGVTVTDHTLTLGHAICARISLDGTKGVDEVGDVLMGQGRSSHETAVLTVLAVQQLCPSNATTLKAWEAQP